MIAAPDDGARMIAAPERAGTSLLPGISVVVPVHNAAGSLRRCIESILGQDYPRARLEAIFVDNGSTDDSLAVLATYGDSIKVVREPRRGAAAARNAGIRMARHEFIACVDADCVTDPSWLAHLADCAARHPEADLIGGAVKAMPDSNAIACFAERYFDQGVAVKGKPPYAISGNVFARKAVLMKVGLFDESMLRGHDTDLSYRAGFEHGAKFAFAADAIVFHHNPSSVADLFREGMKHGRGSAFILAKHGARLQVSPLSRALDRRRYRRIVDNLKRYAAGRLGAGKDRGAAAEHLWDAAYNIGKQIGMLRQIAVTAIQGKRS
jgi:glycosyltransferase involved in cell wall biosynthesis